MSLMDKVIGILMPAVVLMQVIERFYVYWIVDRDSIQEHGIWKRTNIPCSDILRVAGRGYYWSRRPMQLRVDYFRGSELPKSGKLYASPADIDGFVKALRSMAPSATIDV
jgi:hypothetical protein